MRLNEHCHDFDQNYFPLLSFQMRKWAFQQEYTIVCHICIIFRYFTWKGRNSNLATKHFDKRIFSFSFVNLPYLCSNIPSSPDMGSMSLFHSICNSMLYIRAISKTRQSTFKQVDEERLSKYRLRSSLQIFLWSI